MNAIHKQGLEALYGKNLCTTEKSEFIIKFHHSKNMKHSQEIPRFQDFG